ncbi:MAG: L-threonylcarbamoyladenylate synthase [Candidatus Jorgensenbacteria bacterium]
MTTGEIAKILEKGGIGVMPTDTLYGLVGLALSRPAVERIYLVRKREKNKPFIVLIASPYDLKKFGVKASQEHLKILKALWFTPSRVKGTGPVSVILPCESKKFSYLHRGKNSIAFRLPKSKRLRELLKKTGPLIAPSANPSGKSPAKTIAEAKKYFGPKVDFYLDGGKRNKKPSSIVALIR